VLVDTSIWVKYFHDGNGELVRLLDRGMVWTHPLIIGELACGRFRDRRAVFGLLHQLPSLGVVSHEEALSFLDAHDLFGRGLGWIDVHLLATARLTSEPLWTRDRDLASACRLLGLDVTHG